MGLKLPENIAILLKQAIAYDESGDVYNAVKLYKRVLCLAPDEIEPYLRLVRIYKVRCEWKSVLHYAKKVVSLDAGQHQVWWDLGLAASALGRDRIARSVWSKFAAPFRWKKRIVLQLSLNGAFEIVLARAIDPTRAILCSIPHPESGMRYWDLVLFDREVVGYSMHGNSREPVFPVLYRVKPSFFNTYCCILENCTKSGLEILSRLCEDADIGWEIWSDATWESPVISEGKRPEFFGKTIFKEEGATSLCIALAAKQEEEAREVLNNWALISLGTYMDFRVLGGR